MNRIFFTANLVCLSLLFLSGMAMGQAAISDSRHYSNVFGEMRNYRIFLPPGYHDIPGKRYPVIYFYHGWSQRYFGSTREFRADEGDSNGGDNIANFVARNGVIVVKPDGYNRLPGEEYYLRPYNISPVETYRQFPLYFPELVKHIDDTYRTIPDRGHRAISGLSMGGFMTFWISGKYPHLVSAAGNFCGSTEFFVGPKDFPVEYRHQDLYKNYGGLNVRLNFGDKDFIRAYHRDMNKVWTEVLDNYEYHVYDAEHTTCGLGEMFTFLMKTFENPPDKPDAWDHIDVYPSFSVWDYEVQTDRNVPGFTVLERVSKSGFRSSVRTFIPDGELMPFVRLTLQTAPLYEHNETYEVCVVDISDGSVSKNRVKSDQEGRIRIELGGGLKEVGISQVAGKPHVVAASTRIGNLPWVTHGREVQLSVKALNKGASTVKKLIAEIVPVRETVTIKQSKVNYGSLEPGMIAGSAGHFSFIVNNTETEMIRLKIIFRDESGEEWHDVIDLPVRVDGPGLEYVIADGREFVVSAAGIDSARVMLGSGNGDGIANPGESVVVLVKENGIYHRTFLHTSDPYINPNGIHQRESDNWAKHDHVGASAKYSVPLIAAGCPENHTVRFFAEYWLPDYPDHIIRRGTITLKVQGTDRTPPVLRWTRMNGDNTFHARFLDGGNISTVTARFIPVDKKLQSFEIKMNDQGKMGDVAANDLVFGSSIEQRGFGLYTVELEAVDQAGNKMTQRVENLNVVF